MKTLEWKGGLDGHLTLIDQTLLPGTLISVDCTSVETVWDAIKQLKVRGAPAIGVSAAYGVVIGLQSVADDDDFTADLNRICDYLSSSRPTAVNLFWALDRMRATAEENSHLPFIERKTRLLAEAKAIDDEDKAMCRAIGQNGYPLLPDQCGVLTHCNAGGLATAGDGTALSLFFAAHEAGRQIHVFADETRPLLQGARLTAWELQQRNVPVTVICDNMAAQVMKEGRIQAVVTGADRIAANGDSANKIGTYSVALLAKAHGIPMYIAAPSSTFDLSLENGDLIPIEQRERSEVSDGFGRTTVPEGVDVYNPAFDVTPHELITAIITERGVIEAPNTEAVRKHLAP